MSQDTERLSVRDLAVEIVDGIRGHSIEFSDDCARHEHDYRFVESCLAELAREVQELRHLRDNVLPDLRQELDNANAYIAELLAEVAQLRADLEPWTDATL